MTLQKNFRWKPALAIAIFIGSLTLSIAIPAHQVLKARDLNISEERLLILRSQIADQQVLLEKLSQEVLGQKNVKDQLKIYRDQVEELESRKYTLSMECQSLQLLKENEDNLKSVVIALKKDRVNIEKKIADMQAELAAITSTAESKQQLEGQVNALTRKQIDLSMGVGKLEKLVENVTELQTKFADLDLGCDDLSRKKAHLEKDIKNLNKIRYSLEDEVKQLDKESIDTRASVEDALTRKRELKHDVDELDILLKRNKTQLETLTTENQGLELKVAQLKTEVSNLQTAKTSLSTVNEALAMQQKELEDVTASVQQKKAEKVLCETFSAEKENLKRKVAQLKTEVSNLQNTKKSLDSVKQELEDITISVLQRKAEQNLYSLKKGELQAIQDQIHDKIIELGRLKQPVVHVEEKE